MLFALKYILFRFMTQVEAAVPALAIASILTVVMGLTRQVAEGHPAIDPIGLTRMLSFWPFVLNLFLERNYSSRSRNTPACAFSEALHSFAH